MGNAESMDRSNNKSEPDHPMELGTVPEESVNDNSKNNKDNNNKNNKNWQKKKHKVRRGYGKKNEPRKNNKGHESKSFSIIGIKANRLAGETESLKNISISGQ